MTDDAKDAERWRKLIALMRAAYDVPRIESDRFSISAEMLVGRGSHRLMNVSLTFFDKRDEPVDPTSALDAMPWPEAHDARAEPAPTGDVHQDDDDSITRFLAPVIEAVANENWGIVRERLGSLVADRQAPVRIFVSPATIDGLFREVVRRGRTEPFLRILKDIDFELRAMPLVRALEAVEINDPDHLARIEPEARGAAEMLYRRLTA
jgi:hypothetical protein